MKRSVLIFVVPLAVALLFTFAAGQKKKPVSKARAAPAQGKSITPAGWKRHIFLELQQSIAVPPGADRDTESMTFFSGAGDFSDGIVKYSASIDDRTMSPEDADMKALFEAYSEMVENSYNGERRKLRPIVHQGVKGYEMEYDLVEMSRMRLAEDTDTEPEADRFKTRFFVIKNKLYMLTASYLRDRVNIRKASSINQRINGFLNSLEFLANPEEDNYTVLDNYVLTNKKLGFSITFEETPDHGVFWYFRRLGLDGPFNRSKEWGPEGFNPVVKKDQPTQLFTAFLKTPGGGEAKCKLNVNLIRAAAGADVKDVTLAEQRRITKKPGSNDAVGEVECASYADQPGCTFLAVRYPDPEDEDEQNGGKANNWRYIVIKLNETAFLRIDWMAKDADDINQIDVPMESFKILK